jgi:hypothetical protein
MPRFSNKTQDSSEPTDTGTPAGGTSTATQDLADKGIVESTPEDKGMSGDQVVLQKNTIFSSTSYQYPDRTIKPNQDDFAKIKNDGIYDTRFVNQPSLRSLQRGNPSVPFVYNGPQLIDETSGTARIAGPGYSANGDDVQAEFFGVTSPGERALLISTATKLGLFFNSKPSPSMVAGTGLNNTDANAVQGLLNYSTKSGYTWRTVAARLSSGMIASPIISGSGSGSSYSVVSTEDAMAAAKDAWFSVLKRPPTAAEMKQAAITIQQNERTRAQGNTMDPASLKTAAAQQAQKTSPGEYAATSAGNALTRMFSLFGGR